jgi:hypothetical protein
MTASSAAHDAIFAGARDRLCVAAAPTPPSPGSPGSPTDDAPTPAAPTGPVWSGGPVGIYVHRR